MSSDILITREFVSALLEKLANTPERPYRKAPEGLTYAGLYIPAPGFTYSMETAEAERRFIRLETGAIYTMRVEIERDGKAAHVRGFINGTVAYEQDWLIDVTLAMRYSAMGYLPNEAAAVSGAFDCMMSKLGK